MIDSIAFQDVKIGQLFGIAYQEINTKQIYVNNFVKISDDTAQAADCDDIIKICNILSTCWIDVVSEDIILVDGLSTLRACE